MDPGLKLRMTEILTEKNFKKLCYGLNFRKKISKLKLKMIEGFLGTKESSGCL